ncbi:MAG: PmoA family protein [Chitinophagaceae bacterium]|nr:PmoA family protein [Chitinophagaceae bacterium]
MLAFTLGCFSAAIAQKQEKVRVEKAENENSVSIYIGEKLFTRFLYPDSLEKPVLYPLHAPSGAVVTRGYPLNSTPGDPTDHPHHVGVWFNYENVNGLDFWNNSFAIPENKKYLYGWIKTDSITKTSGGSKGILAYRARWINKQQEQLLEESTTMEFSGAARQRIIDRTTVLKAVQDVLFKDVKDGMLGIRVAHTLQIPSKEDQKFMDDKGIVTVVKAGSDTIATGNYITSEGASGNKAWSTRARWCMLYGKIGSDSVSITVIDHPRNPNYPTFWHARGYGLFAANPLGESVFTNGKSSKNLRLKKGESVTFRYRIIIDENRKVISPKELNAMADAFGK